MRKALCMAGALLAIPPALAFGAPGVDLAWNHCINQTGAAEFRTSACDANTGSQSMFASFNPPAGVTALEGVEVFVDYQICGGSLPCWWNFAAGQPRNSQLTALDAPPTDANGDPVVRCGNYYFFDHGAFGVGGMIVTGVDRGQLKGLVSLWAGTGQPVPADAQQYAFGFRIDNGGTVGENCPGCIERGCFVLNQINLISPPSCSAVRT